MPGPMLTTLHAFYHLNILIPCEMNTNSPSFTTEKKTGSKREGNLLNITQLAGKIGNFTESTQ